MKKIILLIVVFCLFMFGYFCVFALDNSLMGKKIVIDAGHGGKDSGTVFGDILEKDINLSIAIKLRVELLKNGVEVLMTRDGDYDLASPKALSRKKNDFDNRINVINGSNADLYISIHINYLDNTKYFGSQVFFTKGNEKLANIIQGSFINNLKSPMNERELDNNIYMYKKLNIPGVLIECGFISNNTERRKLIDSSYQDKIVDSIVKGLIKFYQ